MTTVNANPPERVTFRLPDAEQKYWLDGKPSSYEEIVAHRVKTFGTLKDSGKREEFPTGAVRDSQEGKGFFTGITLEAARRLALVTEEGAAKYSKRNWEKGMPVERCLNSALRHVFQYLDGWDDEDHLGQALWNVAAAVTMEERAEAGRLPKDLLLETRHKYVGHPEAG